MCILSWKVNAIHFFLQSLWHQMTTCWLVTSELKYDCIYDSIKTDSVQHRGSGSANQLSIDDT